MLCEPGHGDYGIIPKGEFGHTPQWISVPTISLKAQRHLREEKGLRKGEAPATTRLHGQG